MPAMTSYFAAFCTTSYLQDIRVKEPKITFLIEQAKEFCIPTIICLDEKLTAQEVEEIRSVFKEHNIIAEVTFTENNLQLLHAQMMEVVRTNEAAKRASA